MTIEEKMDHFQLESIASSKCSSVVGSSPGR